MDIITTTLTFGDPGEFQLWAGVVNNAVHRVDADAAIADADKVVKAARARIPIVAPVSTRKQ